jgi:hypothetical protein
MSVPNSCNIAAHVNHRSMDAHVPERNPNALSKLWFIVGLTCIPLVLGLFTGSIRPAEKLESVGAYISYQKLLASVLLRRQAFRQHERSR